MSHSSVNRFGSALFAKFPTVLIVLIAMAVQFATPTDAQRRGPSLVRDAEIEALVKDYARPLMKAAGLRRGSVAFYIVNDSSFNAFVSGRGMFINTGLLLQAETPGEVIGVIAHELGHIVGAHQIRLRQRIDEAQRIARIQTLLGLGIGAAGAAAGESGVAAAGLGVAAGGQSTGLRSILKYRRSEESSADATAVRLLNRTKQSGKGMLTTFEKLSKQLGGISRRVDPYLQSHPLPRERIRNLGNAIRKSRYFKSRSPANLRLRHDMVRAKIAAYTGGGRYARSLLSGKKLSASARLYGRAITTHLYGSPRRAIPLIDRLIKAQPRNAYAHEMRGEIYLRSGKAKQAASAFRRAVKLDRYGAGFIRVQLGHALVQTGNKKNIKEAVTVIRKGLTNDPTAVAGYRFLGMAYSELGQPGRALLASAQLASRTGRKQQAKAYALRVQQAFKRGSPPWLRAQDILDQK